MRSAADSILAIEKTLVRDFNAGKLEDLLAHFHARVVGFSSTRQERIVGRAAMRKTFDYYHQASPHMKYHIAQPEIHVFGEVAVATFYWTVELGMGRPRHAIHGRGSHVFAKYDGQWLIVHEHFSRAH
jgi:ketosteroid isomerase-like protein